MEEQEKNDSRFLEKAWITYSLAIDLVPDASERLGVFYRFRLIDSPVDVIAYFPISRRIGLLAVGLGTIELIRQRVTSPRVGECLTGEPA